MAEVLVWRPALTVVPDANKEVAVRGEDWAGKWSITGGVWWQPYKGQSHKQGRWMQKDGLGKPMRLPESDEVDEWAYITRELEGK